MNHYLTPATAAKRGLRQVADWGVKSVTELK